MKFRTLFPEPSLLVWVKECMHEIISVILGDLEWFLLYTLIQALFQKTISDKCTIIDQQQYTHTVWKTIHFLSEYFLFFSKYDEMCQKIKFNIINLQ